MTELNAVLKSHSHRCSGDATTSTVVAASQCLGKEPEHEEMCKGEACVSWNLGQWGACSGQCGTGLRHRSVDCAEEMSGDVVPDGRCNKPKPSTSSACGEAACQVQICHIMILTFLILPIYQDEGEVVLLGGGGNEDRRAGSYKFEKPRKRFPTPR